MLFRTPVIPGFNDTPAEIGAIASFVKRIQGQAARLDLLPFHHLAAGKYHSLGLAYAPDRLAPPSAGSLAALAEAVKAQGVRVRGN